MSDRLTLSWSRLKSWESCKQQVLRRKQGKSSYSPMQGRVFLPGTIADRCMRAYLELENPQPGGICDPLEEIFERFAFTDDQYVIKWKGNPLDDQKKVKENVRIVLENLEPQLWDFVIPNGYQVEYRFRTTVGIPYLDGKLVPVDLIGGIDILTAKLGVDGQPEEYSVYDLKATFDDSYVRGSILAQLIFYSIVVKTEFGKYPVNTAFLTPACKQKYVPLVVSPDDVRTMMSRIISYCNGVWKDQWDPKSVPDNECTWCEVHHACDLFRIEPGKKASFLELAAKRGGKSGS